MTTITSSQKLSYRYDKVINISNGGLIFVTREYNGTVSNFLEIKILPETLHQIKKAIMLNLVSPKTHKCGGPGVVVNVVRLSHQTIY